MEEDINSSGEMFWKRFDTKVKEKSLSQNYIALKAGISSQSISVARKSGSMPSFDRGMKIANALGVSAEYMLTGETHFDEELDEAFIEIARNPLASNLAIDIASFNYKERQLVALYIKQLKSTQERDVEILTGEDFPDGT